MDKAIRVSTGLRSPAAPDSAAWCRPFSERDVLVLTTMFQSGSSLSAWLRTSAWPRLELSGRMDSTRSASLANESRKLLQPKYMFYAQKCQGYLSAYQHAGLTSSGLPNTTPRPLDAPMHHAPLTLKSHTKTSSMASMLQSKLLNRLAPSRLHQPTSPCLPQHPPPSQLPPLIDSKSTASFPRPTTSST